QAKAPQRKDTDMTLSRTHRRPILVAALACTAAIFGTAAIPYPVEARDGPYYIARLAQPAAETRAVAGGVAWACKGDICVANKGNSRPINVCRDLNREFGEITAFTARGKDLEADKLAKCNGN
ncbi:MAG: CC_3452 family protein, partial [Erythrobacter sp.]